MASSVPPGSLETEGPGYGGSPGVAGRPGTGAGMEGMEGGARPAVAGEAVKRSDRARRSAEQPVSLCFRLLQLWAAVISFVVMLVAWQLDLSFRNYHAFRYVLVATVIAAAWSGLMLLVELLQLILGRKTRSLFWRTLVCVMDWLMAILTFSAGCAGAAVTQFNSMGIVLFNYAPCLGGTPYNIFCTRTKVSVAFAFITFGFLLPHLILSTLSLLMRYYEG